MKEYELLGVAPTAGKKEIHAAYRELARRWHPDRFAEGPERDWAGEHMAEINAAYRACMHNRTERGETGDDAAALKQIQEMIADGHYHSARRMLMNITTRCAEWNYLFGAVLLKTRETGKAIIYLSVAAHQRPGERKYARALAEAQGARAAHNPLAEILRRLAR